MFDTYKRNHISWWPALWTILDKLSILYSYSSVNFTENSKTNILYNWKFKLAIMFTSRDNEMFIYRCLTVNICIPKSSQVLGKEMSDFWFVLDLNELYIRRWE